MSAAMGPPEASLAVVITVNDSPERRVMKRRPPARAFDHRRSTGIIRSRPSREERPVFERFKRDSEGTATDREARTANGRTAVAERPADTRTTAMEGETAHTRTRDEEALREEQA